MQSILVSAITNPTTIEAVKGKISEQVSKLPSNRVEPFSTAWSHLNTAVNAGIQQAKSNPVQSPVPTTSTLGGKRKKRNQTRKLKRKLRN